MYLALAIVITTGCTCCAMQLSLYSSLQSWRAHNAAISLEKSPSCNPPLLTSSGGEYHGEEGLSREGELLARKWKQNWSGCNCLSTRLQKEHQQVIRQKLRSVKQDGKMKPMPQHHLTLKNSLANHEIFLIGQREVNLHGFLHLANIMSQNWSNRSPRSM